MRRSSATVRPAATIACAATCPPNTRWCGVSGLSPRKRFTSSGSRSRRTSSASSDVGIILSDATAVPLTEEHLELREQRARHRVELAYGVFDRYPHDVVAPQRDHRAERAVLHRGRGLETEAGREDAVECGRRAAA